MIKRPTPEQELSRLLDENGGEFGAIYHRLSRPEPPRRLDRMVLANAARAVQGGRAPRAQRWALAMGSAAGVVLAAGIAWQVGQQMQTNESIPEGSHSTQDSRVVPVEAITEPRPRPKAKSDVIMRDADSPKAVSEEKRGQLEPLNKQSRHLPPLPPPEAVSPAIATPPPAPAAPPAPHAPQAAAAPSPSMSQSAPEESAASARRMESEAEAFPGTKDATRKGSITQSDRAQGAVKESGAAAGGSSGALEARSDDSEAKADAASATIVADALTVNRRLPPAVWLEEIERLANAGQTRDAIENLRLFRSQYPDWPLPDALRRLEQ